MSRQPHLLHRPEAVDMPDPTQDGDQASTQDRAEALLLKAAAKCNIRARRDEVHQAVEHDAAFAEWAVSHLARDTLISPDELALYTALDRSGEVDRLAALHDLGEAPQLDDDAVRAAVDELRRSTQSIAKQTEALKQQQAALQRMLSKEADVRARRQDLEATRRRKLEVEYRELVADVAGLTQGIEFRLSDLDDYAKDAGQGLTTTIGTAFQSDDKLLSSLQKLGWELKQEDPEETQNVEKLREICMRLIKTTVETVRAKLDTVYLDALYGGSSSDDTETATHADVKALEEELESLYSEILPVAQMSIEQQHLEPALKNISQTSGQSLNRSAVAVTYVDECLDYLLSRAELLRDRVETHNSHQDAAAAIAAIAKRELASAEPRLPPPKPQVVPDSPMRNPLPVRRRRSSIAPEDTPLETLLASLALSLPDAETDDRIAAVEALLAERTAKEADVARATHEAFEGAVMAQLDDARLAVQLLRDSVLAETPFGEVQLVDGEAESSIAVLAQEVGTAKQRLAEVEGMRGGKSEKRAELVRRWGS